jgi:hypothetical protein
MKGLASINPRNHSWEKSFEGDLPDCRVSPFERESHRVAIGRMLWDIVFCAQCHKPQGASPPSCPHVFFICDSCVTNHPPPPEIMRRKVPGT